jgi:hypothetical protein
MRRSLASTAAERTNCSFSSSCRSIRARFRAIGLDSGTTTLTNYAVATRPNCQRRRIFPTYPRLSRTCTKSLRREIIELENRFSFLMEIEQPLVLIFSTVLYCPFLLASCNRTMPAPIPLPSRIAVSARAARRCTRLVSSTELSDRPE